MLARHGPILSAPLDALRRPSCCYKLLLGVPHSVEHVPEADAIP
jgi:hypothetical protein